MNSRSGSAQCRLCRSSRTRRKYAGDANMLLTPEDFSVTKARMKKSEVSWCLDCGVLYNSSAEVDVRAYASVQDPEYEKGSTLRRREFAAAFEKAVPHLPAGANRGCFLDIGCLSGVFAEYLKNYYPQADVSGIEPSAWGAELCRRKGITVFHGGFEDFEFEKERYDLISLFDVLEHVQNPFSLLERVHLALKPGGIVLVTTPNIESLFHRIMGRRYWFIEAMHLYYFSPKTLGQLLGKAGLRPVLRRRHLKHLGSRYFFKRLRGILGWHRQERASSPQEKPGTEKIFRFYAGQMLVIARKQP